MYVSTVDSGNLASYVLTLRVALLALPDDPILSRRTLAGLADTLDVLQGSHWRRCRSGARSNPARDRSGHRRWPDAASRCEAATRPAGGARRRALDSDAGNGVRDTAAEAARTQDWAAMLLRQCQVARDELVSPRPVAVVAGRSGGSGGAAAGHADTEPSGRLPISSRSSPADIERALETCADASIREWLIALQ